LLYKSAYIYLMPKKIKTIPITTEDVAFIFNDRLDEFEFVTSRCFCVACKNEYNSTITSYTIKLNNLYDIELDGFCKVCNHKMGRYIETGETPATAKNAEAIWKTNKALKELKIKKEK
jgi:hypothetical protein